MTKTLLELSGADTTPAALSKAVLILIDIQNEYFDGPYLLENVTRAMARAALDLGFLSTVTMDAIGSRALPDPYDGIVPAETAHRTALAELTDRFATVAAVDNIPD